MASRILARLPNLRKSLRAVAGPTPAGATEPPKGRIPDAPLKFGHITFMSGPGALLGEHLGEDVARLTNLLEGLAAAYGEGARIGVDELTPFLGQAGGVAPWELTDAIDAGDTDTALVKLRRMTDAGERHPLVVMATLHRHYANMLRLDGADDVHDEQAAAAVLGTAPFPAKKALTQARRLVHGTAEMLRRGRGGIRVEHHAAERRARQRANAAQ